MQAHASDLRAEIEQDWSSLTDGGEAAGKSDLDSFVHSVVDDWRQARASSGVMRLMQWADKITRSPATCAKTDVDELRQAGWSDEAIHDAAQVIAYFNYINRIADSLGVPLEHDMPRWGTWKSSKFG